MESSERTNLVISRDGLHGIIDPAALPLDHGRRVPVQFENGERLLLPVNFLNRQDDGSYILPFPIHEAQRLWPGETPKGIAAADTLTIPVAEERLTLSKRKVETGRVRIVKRVAAHEEDVDEPLVRETVQVERVPVNRTINEPVPVRYEGDTMIVPVFEETLVVEKRLILREELRITKRRAESHKSRRATLRREEVSVERTPPRSASALDLSESEAGV
ncbi:YsnF/AvaK domain-containing protein [Methylomagnum sp.]